MPKAKQKRHKACVKIFAPWQKHKEEAWLSALSEKGWHLTEVRGGAGYVFEYGPGKKRAYALVYTSSGEVEASGWKRVAQSGRYAYYVWEEAGEGVFRPTFGDEQERQMLASLRTNLITGLLLNVPGVLLCLFYVLAFFSGGLYWADLVKTNGIWYVFFLLWGLFAMFTFFRWALQAGKCAKRLSVPFDNGESK